MAIEIAWGNDEQTLLRWIFPAVWSWEDLEHAAGLSSSLLHSVTHQVDMVMLICGGHFPEGNAFAHLARTMNQRYQNFHRMVVVGGGGSFESKFVSIMIKLYGMWTNKVQHANSMEEACVMLSCPVEVRQL